MGVRPGQVTTLARSDHPSSRGRAAVSRNLGWRLTLGAIAALAVGLGLAWISGLFSSSGPGQLYVSPRGSDSNACTRSRPCRSISRAVMVAHPGEQVDVGPGTYPEQVMLTKRLTIRGVHSPLVDARGHGRGIVVAGAGAAGSVVEGLVVEHATYEGILALGTTRVTIAHNVVRNNDRGFSPTISPESARRTASRPMGRPAGRRARRWMRRGHPPRLELQFAHRRESGHR